MLPYWTLVLFSVTRIVLCFVILFVWVGPKFLPHARKLKGIDRMLYTWVGVGGTMLTCIFLLCIAHLYDLISLFSFLIAVPIIVSIYKELKKGTSIRSIHHVFENRIVSGFVKFIETIRDFSFKGLKEQFKPSFDYSIIERRYTISAILIGVSACIIRLIPILINASPFSRAWYFELEAIKNIRLQQYFGDLPAPRGMHALVDMFSSLTQVSAEMTLNLLGSITSFFLTLIVYWIILEITKGKRRTAALFGASVYAFFPTLLLPITLGAENGSNSLSLALCFALPTAFIFIRNIRAIDKAPWFYVSMGIIATGLTNVFVLLIVLLPFQIYALLGIPRRRYLQNFIKLVSYLAVNYAVVLAPYIIHLLLKGGNILSYFDSQLLDTMIFSYFPHLVLELSALSEVYFFIAIGLLTVFLILNLIDKEEHFVDEMVYFALFLTVSVLYTSFVNIDIYFLDLDQLNAFYAILISVLFGLGFYGFFTIVSKIFDKANDSIRYVQPVAFLLLLGNGIFITGGIKVEKTLPQTMPEGFFNAYYNIIHDRLPYTYATVSPPIDDALAQNRHYFMNYEFFLNSYSEIDEEYNQYLEVPEELRSDSVSIPPASIFVFVQKPPYTSIQQGILYDSQRLMTQLDDWVLNYRSMDGREVEIYYEDESARIYELINRRGESSLNKILMNVYPKKEGRAADLFK
ncbi:hypothetical protein [Balneola vulgaris]|uniref:hypothetical protein n=1 Tax=Balneola vulgaris TaxID=287535 RepID=UPI000380E60F|nr:hypothetical protein [Balneola vulgaris]